MARLVALDGNIGVGKTTFIKPFARRFGYHLIEEPVEDNPYLDRFYADPKRWAYEMEVWFMRERIDAYLRAINLHAIGEKVIIERTHHSCFTFNHNCYFEGRITLDQWEEYERTFDRLCELLPTPDALIIMEAPAEVCHQRMAKRGRPCEKDVIPDYLRGIRRLTRHSVGVMERRGTKVIRLDWEDAEPAASTASALSGVPTSFLGGIAVVVSGARRGVHVQDICTQVRDEVSRAPIFRQLPYLAL